MDTLLKLETLFSSNFPVIENKFLILFYDLNELGFTRDQYCFSTDNGLVNYLKDNVFDEGCNGIISHCINKILADSLAYKQGVHSSGLDLVGDKIDAFLDGKYLELGLTRMQAFAFNSLQHTTSKTNDRRAQQICKATYRELEVELLNANGLIALPDEFMKVTHSVLPPLYNRAVWCYAKGHIYKAEGTTFEADIFKLRKLHTLEEQKIMGHTSFTPFLRRKRIGNLLKGL